MHTSQTQSYKKDFPIFSTNSGLIYLDSGASAQKPAMVIDGIKDFLSQTYANIHRGSYDISEQAEDLYYASKVACAKLLNISGDTSGDEIIYTYNATYAYNLLAQSLWYSWVLEAGDVVLVDIAEHHANIVPWQMLSQRHGIIVERIDLDANFQYNLEDFKKKYTDRVKVVSLSAASNVTGVLYNLRDITSLLREDTFFVVDGSQAIPHVPIHMCFGESDIYWIEEIWNQTWSQNQWNTTLTKRIDALIFTGHKIMADTGLGVLYLAKKHIKSLTPARGGGGMIEDVNKESFKTAAGWQKFEAGTPHIVWAVSLLRAIEYINSIWGYKTIINHETNLVTYALARIAQNPNLVLLGMQDEDITLTSWDNTQFTLPRLGIFSLTHKNLPNHIRLGETLAMQGICVRCGGHCTHPLFHTYEQNGSCRISLYIYNDISDLEKTFDILDTL